MEIGLAMLTMPAHSLVVPAPSLGGMRTELNQSILLSLQTNNYLQKAQMLHPQECYDTMLVQYAMLQGDLYRKVSRKQGQTRLTCPVQEAQHLSNPVWPGDRPLRFQRFHLHRSPPGLGWGRVAAGS